MSKKYATSGPLYPNSVLYHKAHAFEEIQELYQIYRLTYGNSPIKFVRESGSDNNNHSDYGLCAAVIAEAQKLKDAGAGKIKFTTTIDKEKTDARYSYRVYTDHNRHGTDSDSCGSNSGCSYACGSGS